MIQPLGGCLRPHLWHTGDVVHAVAHQRQVIDDALRGNAVLGNHAIAVQGGFRHRIHQRDVIRDKLRHVLVASGNHHRALCARCFGGQGADDVVRFHAFHPHQRHSHRFHHVEDGLDLHAQTIGHRWAIGFVFGVEIVAEGAPAGVEDHRHRAALEVVGELSQHADDAANRAGGEAVQRAQIRQRVKGAKQVGRTIDQQQRL